MSKHLLLTYRDLADRLGISIGAAKARVRRAKWSVIVGNDGVAQIRIPTDDLQDMDRSMNEVRSPATAKENPKKQPISEGTTQDTSTPLVEALRLLAAERERSFALEADARNLTARLAVAETLVDFERERADKAEAALSALPDPATHPDPDPATYPPNVVGKSTVFSALLRKMMK